MEKLEAQELAKEVNQLIEDFRKKRVKIPEDLYKHVSEVVRKLSFGIHDRKDVAEAKMFIDHLTRFYEMNRETYERLTCEPAPVETPTNSNQESLRID